MSFIKKLFQGKIDEEVHRQFTRFGIGTFKDKALIDITYSKKIKLKTSAEFSNELVALMANTMTEPTHVKGIIISTKDLSKQSTIDFKEIKSFMGVKKHIIDSVLTKEQILEICKSFPESSIQLSFKTPYGELKIKEKPPRSSKPSIKVDETPKVDFCTLTTENKNILDEYAFDVKEPFKKLFVSHTYIIKEIKIPEQYKNDFAMARKMATRVGKVIRKLNIDGKIKEIEKEFEA
jgi:hypothetical protein